MCIPHSGRDFLPSVARLLVTSISLREDVEAVATIRTKHLEGDGGRVRGGDGKKRGGRKEEGEIYM